MEKLRKRYPNAPLPLIETCSVVKLLLMDSVYGTNVLGKLQAAIKPEQSLDEYLTSIEQQQKGKEPGSQNGFRPRQVVFKLLPTDTFLAHLRAPEHLFDLGTPFDHGPHTHRLQWCILYQAHTDGKLTINPIDLYQQLGQDYCKDTDEPTRTVWDDLFDYDSVKAQELIGIQEWSFSTEKMLYAAFSAPEWTLPYLISPAFPAGPLQQELRQINFRQRTFGAESVLNFAEALKERITNKRVNPLFEQLFRTPANEQQGFSLKIVQEQEKIKKQLDQKRLEELEEIYTQEVDKDYPEKQKKALAGIK